MKKMSVIVTLLAVVLVLVFAAEPGLSQSRSAFCSSYGVKTDFSGCRYRTSVASEAGAKIYNCLTNTDNQHAYWKVLVGNPLVDGDWYNWNTEVRRAVVAFTMPSGPNVPCDPSVKNPPEGYKGTVVGAGIISGLFMLTPPAAGGGVWVGTWKTIYNPDGSWVQTVEGEGHGGLIEGMGLYSTNQLAPDFSSNCQCCPAGSEIPPKAYGPMPFGGCLTPARIK